MRFKPNDMAVIKKTNSNLDGRLVRVVGIALEYGTIYYIIDLLAPNEQGWTHTTLTEHCLDRAVFPGDEVAPIVHGTGGSILPASTRKLGEEIASSPEESRRFLYDAGIITKDGKLTSRYR